ncbi:hypothetical protein L1049_010566 [Liquidambar formosana]|uniref:Uncharacterized protein n=1 Tax=Liquidambar formosana TaxID=63359 RepID=A0AAP0R788_LIQFO
MKKLIRRLSRVADSSHYSVLRSDSPESSSSRTPRRSNSLRTSNEDRSDVPEGHLPVYVGDEMERFIVNAEQLNHPIFVELLNKSAQEYGYDQRGALRIPIHVLVFERFLEMLRLGHDVANLEDLIRSVSVDIR